MVDAILVVNFKLHFLIIFFSCVYNFCQRVQLEKSCSALGAVCAEGRGKRVSAHRAHGTRSRSRIGASITIDRQGLASPEHRTKLFLFFSSRSGCARELPAGWTARCRITQQTNKQNETSARSCYLVPGNPAALSPHNVSRD